MVRVTDLQSCTAGVAGRSPDQGAACKSEGTHRKGDGNRAKGRGGRTEEGRGECHLLN